VDSTSSHVLSEAVIMVVLIGILPPTVRRRTVRRIWAPLRQLRICLLSTIAVLLTGSALLTAAPKEKSPRGSRHEIFEPGRAWEFHITLPQKEFSAMQPARSREGWMSVFSSKPKPAADPGAAKRQVHRNTFGMDLAWAAGSVAVDGRTFENVGIRYK